MNYREYIQRLLRRRRRLLPRATPARASVPWATARRRRVPILETPLISVILPVYNHARYLSDSIRSTLAASTYPIEIIVVDDGSTDDIDPVLTTFRSNPRIKIIRQRNAGLSQALNQGLKLARGVYVTWTSADNMYEPGALDPLVGYLAANPTVGLTYADVSLIDDAGRPCVRSSYRVIDQDVLRPDRLRLPLDGGTLWLFSDNFINACFLSRRSLWLSAGGHATKYRGFEDYDYWLRLSLVSRVSHVDSGKSLYRYRLHGDTMTATIQPERLMEGQRERLAVLHRVRCSLERAMAEATLPLPAASQVADSDRVRQSTSRAGITPGMAWLPELIGARVSEERSTDGIQQLVPNPHLADRDAPLSPTVLAYSCGEQGTTGAQPALLLSQAPVAAENIIRATLCTPPVTLNPVVRRARESSFGAITREQGTAVTALVFPPAGALEEEASTIEKVAQLVRGLSKVTVCLLADGPKQRQWCDAVHLRLGHTPTLRIVDITDESTEGDLAGVSSHDRALLYVLSSADVCVSVASTKDPAEFHTELVRHCALSALAARTHFLLTDPLPPLMPLPDAVVGDSFPPSVELCVKWSEQLLLLNLYEIPHLRVLPWPTVLQAGAPFIRKLQARLRRSRFRRPPVGTLEQWLTLNTEPEVRKRALSMFFSLE